MQYKKNQRIFRKIQIEILKSNIAYFKEEKTPKFNDKLYNLIYKNPEYNDMYEYRRKRTKDITQSRDRFDFRQKRNNSNVQRS